MVMQDKKTETLWSSMTGVAFQGELNGTALETYPFDLVPWKDWVAAHPETRVLKKEVLEPHEKSRYDAYFANPDKLGIFGREVDDDRLATKAIVVAVDTPSGTKVFPIDALDKNKVINTMVGDVPVALVPTSAGGFRAYVRQVNDRVVKLELSGRQLVSGEKAWSMDTGRSETSETPSLEDLRAHVTYWGGWVSFFPQAEIWKAESE